MDCFVREKSHGKLEHNNSERSCAFSKPRPVLTYPVWRDPELERSWDTTKKETNDSWSQQLGPADSGTHPSFSAAWNIMMACSQCGSLLPGKVITRNRPQGLNYCLRKDEQPLLLKRWPWSHSHSRRNTHIDHTHPRGRHVLGLCKARYTQAGPMWTVCYSQQQDSEGAWPAPILLQGLSLSLLVFLLIILCEWVMSSQFPGRTGLWIRKKLTFLPLSLGHTGLGTFNISKHYVCGEKNLGLTNTLTYF